MSVAEIVVPATRDPEVDEGDASILRTGPEAALLRTRMERPARFGRYILTLLGVVTASAGLAEWITTGSIVGLALGAFGGVLIVLGAVQHLLYQRDRAHWPEQAFLWDDGLELVLHNREVRGASWSDPDLALQILDRRAPSPATREYLLVWLLDSKIPPVELSAEGFDRLRRALKEHPLEVSQSLRGARANATRLIEIRPRAPGQSVDLPKGVGT